MYILYNDKQYPCKYRNNMHTVAYSNLPEDFPAPVEGEILLYADDDFLLRIDYVEDFKRQTFVNGTLTLTDIPEPEPTPDPEPTPEPETPDEISWDVLASAITEGINDV